MSESVPWLFVGLGNPGDEYARSRHNVGFMALDYVAREARLGGFGSKHKGEFLSASWGETRVLGVKPQTFMNRSGESVVRVVEFFSLPISQVVVIHDEVDLPFGVVRVKQGGGHGGHNGLRSLHSHLKSSEYLRVRVGIGRGIGELSHYVLSDFSASERQTLESEVFPKVYRALEVIVERGVVAAMNELNAVSSAARRRSTPEGS